MSRVINPESPGKERSQLLKAVVIALDKYFSQEIGNSEKKDLSAFIILTLDAISKTVDNTATAWEKRGYWIKADRFRIDWSWVEDFRLELRSTVLDGDLQKTDKLLLEFSEITKGEVVLPKRHQLGEPWHGAYQKLINST